MAEEVYDESNEDSGVDLDLYQIETEELEEAGLDVDAELQKLAPQYFLREENEPEEVKGERQPSALQQQRDARALEVLQMASEFEPSSL